MVEKGKLSLRKIPKLQITNVDRMRAIEKPPLELHSNNYCGQDSRVNDKISG